VSSRVHLPVVTENDAKAAAWAEFVAGAGAGTEQMTYLTLGTGLGGAIIAEKQLLRGASGFAGEFGHTMIDLNGRICSCGKRGCLETLVSGSAIVSTAREMLQQPGESSLREIEPLTARRIFDAAERGDAVAARVFAETGKYLGIACANIINTFNPQIIVIGGGVMGAGALLIDPAVEEAGRRAFPAALADCRIVKSQLWPHAGTIGAAVLARDQF
jgi:glucokinase